MTTDICISPGCNLQWCQQQMEHTAKLNAGLTQLIQRKPIQLKFCIKIVFLSPNESTIM